MLIHRSPLRRCSDEDTTVFQCNLPITDRKKLLATFIIAALLNCSDKTIRQCHIPYNAEKEIYPEILNNPIDYQLSDKTRLHKRIRIGNERGMVIKIRVFIIQSL